MADNHEPLSDERLNEIRDHISPGHWLIAQHERRQILERDISTLLAEVDRLRTEVAGLRRGMLLSLEPGLHTLRAENAALREIVHEVATEDTLAYEGDAGDDYRCVFCWGHFDWGDGSKHTVPTREQAQNIPRALVHSPDCPVIKARNLLAQE